MTTPCASSNPGCPVQRRGLRLRAVCDRCGGRPASGQIRLDPKTLLCLEGTPAEAVYAVVSGHLRESTQGSEGQTASLRLLRPGDIAGADALLHGTHRCSIESITAATVCVVPTAQLEDTLETRPEQARAVVGTLSAQVVELRESVRRLASMTAEEQVRSLLRELTSDAPAGAWVRLPLTRAEMAEHLGLALATVSRNLQRIARKGELEVRGRNLRWLGPPHRSGTEHLR